MICILELTETLSVCLFVCFLFSFHLYQVGIDFTCRIPERYPDEAPVVDVAATKGLTPKQVEELLLLAKTQVGRCIGPFFLFIYEDISVHGRL